MWGAAPRNRIFLALAVLTLLVAGTSTAAPPRLPKRAQLRWTKRVARSLTRFHAPVFSQSWPGFDFTKRLDVQPPTKPTGLSKTDWNAYSISLRWAASTDNVAVAGYKLFLNGALVGKSLTTSYTFGNLTCDATYRLGVSAFDAAGNTSSTTALSGTTSSCSASDTTPPSTPSGLSASGATTSSVSVSWTASSDNVGVTGYGLYRNDGSVGSTSGTSYTFSGLACGASHNLSVDAYDAAGNRSGSASVTAATTACTSSSAAVYLAPAGSDSNSCSQSAPCASFNRAYRVAQAGQVVEVAGGSYGQQTIQADGGKTSGADVVFRPASGASVSVGYVTVDAAKHLEFRDLKFAGWQTRTGSDDVTFRNITSGELYVSSSSNISVIGGSYGPDTDYDNGQIKPACWGCAHSSNILIDGALFHDAVLSPGSDAHVECLQVWGTDYLTIRNSKFVNCETHNVFFAGEGDPVTHVVFENNWGGRVRSGYYSFRIAAGTAGEGCTDVLFRNNSATTPVSIECSSATNVRVIANVSPFGASKCDGRYAYSHNVWNGAKCGASDVNAPSGFVNATAFDLHLAAGSAAVDRGDPDSYPANDIDGQARPLGGAPDAGADEGS